MLVNAAANRDPRRYECPAEFDVTRTNARTHLAFGHGAHTCPGAPLARAEGRVSIERLLDRTSGIGIDEAVHGPRRRAPLRVRAHVHPPRAAPSPPRDRRRAMTAGTDRAVDLVELQALCSRYMMYTSQYLQDHWLDVFTPDAEYNAFGTPYTLERFPALLEAAPRGQFIGNMPVVDFDGDAATGTQHFVFIDQKTHAMRLGWYRDEYVRTASGWRIRRRATTFMRKHGGFDSGRQHDPLEEHRRDRRDCTSPASSASTTTSSSPRTCGRTACPRSTARRDRVERARWGEMALGAGASYRQEMSDDGMWGDYWVYEDRLVYLHKRHVTIPLEATPGGDLARFDRSKLVLAAITYEEMRPGCYEPKARVDDLAASGVDGSLAFPTFPRFCGQTFLEGKDPELGLECVRAYNDYMIEEWCGDADGHLLPLCLIPLWDVDLAVAEINRNAGRGARAMCFSEIPTHLGLPSIHTGTWDPFFAACEETRTTICMHIGSSSKMPAASPDAPASTETMLGFYISMASLADFLFSGVLVRFPTLQLAYSEGQIGWLPYALERADNVWEYHAAWTGSHATIPEPPSTYYYGRVFGCFTTDRHGVDVDQRGR